MQLCQAYITKEEEIFTSFGCLVDDLANWNLFLFPDFIKSMISVKSSSAVNLNPAAFDRLLKDMVRYNFSKRFADQGLVDYMGLFDNNDEFADKHKRIADIFIEETVLKKVINAILATGNMKCYMMISNLLSKILWFFYRPPKLMAENKDSDSKNRVSLNTSSFMSAQGKVPFPMVRRTTWVSSQNLNNLGSKNNSDIMKESVHETSQQMVSNYGKYYRKIKITEVCWKKLKNLCMEKRYFFFPGF